MTPDEKQLSSGVRTLPAWYPLMHCGDVTGSKTNSPPLDNGIARLRPQFLRLMKALAFAGFLIFSPFLLATAVLPLQSGVLLPALGAIAVLTILGLVIYASLVARRNRRQLQQLREQEQQLTLLTDNMTDIVWRVDANSHLIYVSPSIEKVLGYKPEEMVGQAMSFALEPEASEFMFHFKAQLETHARRGEYDGFTDTNLELAQRHKEGHRIWTDVVMRVFFTPEGNFDGAQGATRDIDARKQAEDAIRHLAFNDPLTRLPNRRLLTDRLNQALANCSRHRQMCGIFFLDLDNFKYLNDSYGHEAGDSLLLQVADRLRDHLRESDTIARYGGDEFVIISQFLGDSRDQAQERAQHLGDKIVALFQEPFEIAGQPYPMHTSVGAALCEGEDATIKELVRRADLAMYQAKLQGHNQVVIANLQ